ncbi:MAG: glycosyltransferase [Patescibacteria group bacterium]|nr:glycosyltransferase [Patescibacteria group bacterium]
MKVLYLITKGVWGGAGRYVYDLATAPEEAGNEAVVACGQGHRLPSKLQEAGVRSIFIEPLGRDVNPLADWQSFREIYRLLGREQPDVVHLNSSKIGGLGALATRLYNLGSPMKTKIIFTAHGWPFNEPRRALARGAIKFISWLTIMLCHQVIVIAKKESEQALAMPFISPRKIRLIYNGVKPINTLTRKEARDSLIKTNTDLGLVQTGSLWVGVIAELHTNKGLRYLIEAVDQLPEDKQPTVVIIGEGEKRDELEKMIIDLELDNKIFLLGAIPEAARYLPAFDLFVLPSVKEGLPYTLLEAGQASLPVISTTVGGIPEIIADRESGLLAPSANSTALAEALEELMASPDQRQAYGQRLKQKVFETFSFEQMLTHTREVYRPTRK